MKKIILFSIIFSLFSIFDVTYAIPFVAMAVPYILNTWIFLIMFLASIVSYLFVYILKNYKFFGYIFLGLSIISFLIILTVLWINWLNDITLLLELKYIYILFIVLWSSIFIVLYNLKIIKNKKIFLSLYIIWNLVLILFSSINYSLLKDVYYLNKIFNELTNDFSNKVDDNFKFTTPLILNHIIASRDFKYIYEWKAYECRLTISYYDKNMKKTDTINMYVWLSNLEKCYNIFNN
jgi:hypothetical protein